MRPKSLGSFQKVTISNFFDESNPESHLQHWDGMKKKPKGKGSLQKARVITGDLGKCHLKKLLKVTSWKRPKFF